MRKTSSCIVSFLVLLICTYSFAQKQNHQWRFGIEGGINFNTNDPSNVSGSAISTGEGSASIADRNTGDLLFYTNGVTVWNALDQIMPNGNGLLGGTQDLLSSTTAAVIIPRPGTNNLYYIVTIDEQTSNNGIRYSVVDMTLNGGLGDIVSGQKNIFLFDTKSEKLQVVPSSDGLGYWLVTHDNPGNSFFSFKVTNAGIQSTPIVSSVGGIQGNGAGHMKINRQFTKIAMGNIFDSSVEIFDFDNSTGLVSNPVIFEFNFPNPLIYGVEFSPNGKVLYISNIERLIQYDLSQATSASIGNSAYQVSSGNYQAGSLQLGPDNKIYINAGRVDAIICPDNLGIACDFQRNVIANQTGGGGYGLPQWIYYLDEEPELSSNAIISSDSCFSSATQFSIQDTSGITAVEWSFGDPNAGINNTASGLAVSHTFTGIGVYDIRAIVFNNCNSDTLFLRDFQIIDCGVPEIGIDGIKISGDTCNSLTLDLQVTGTSNSPYFFWDFGDPDSGVNDTITITGLSPAAFPTHTFTFPGRYNVCVSFQEPGFEVSTICRLISVGLCCKGFISVTDSCSQDNIQFSIISNDDIISASWNFGNSLSGVNNISSAISPTHLFSAAGTYIISAIVNFACGADTIFRTLTIVNCDTASNACKFFVPSAFSPNADGINDDIFPYTNCVFEQFYFSIFDRWGGLLYESSDPSVGWNGKIKETECPAGEYVYLITYKFPSQEAGKVAGSFTLIR